MLSGIAQTLTTVIGPGGAVGRFGGDEFVALVPVEGKGVPLDLTRLWSAADRALHAAKQAGCDVVDTRGSTRHP